MHSRKQEQDVQYKSVIIIYKSALVSTNFIFVWHT